MATHESTFAKSNFTKAQLNRIQKNKLKAETLKKTKLMTHPYAKQSAIKKGGVFYKDTGGGFLLEENPEEPEKEVTPTIEQPLICELNRSLCKTCNKSFAKSWLFDNFDYKVCDECKDEDIHKLITKTTAKKEYLLKDCDLEKREPPLRYISRKNPHHSQWGEMKLYLQMQVEKRALEVWGSEEKLQEELKKREEKRVVAKGKKYKKQMKELGMSMRSSLHDRRSSFHVHEFGEGRYNEGDDTYTRGCLTCSYEETFEKI